MLSFRRILQQWPQQARFFVLALALLQFVAPTWHVCEMGGHVMSNSSMAGHSGMSMAVQPKKESPSGPLICYCAPKDAHPTDPNAQQLSATPAEHHVTCLALLLQTMPGDFAATPSLFSFSASYFTQPTVAEEFPTLSTLRHFRGRAPPQTL